MKVPLTFALDLARCLEQAWRTIRSSVALDSDQAEAGQKIHAALQTNGCLPTQWIAQLADHRLRLDEAD